ncbi:hypothetical protein CVT24_006110 [Panaeolus cyanescens]|uniref:Sec39 domain-containing protein n=1 Tax=Panaeolus cyanescens TaxID=181874 RepID=A0A409V8T1_9AGAR|nr:hypothetical protein CVT24_006110 [Panaeolus cyanescens]
MASSSAQWFALQDEDLTGDVIYEILDTIQDDLWVISACTDRVLNDVAAQQALLTIGIARSDPVVRRCKDVIALASPSQHGSSSQTYHTLVSHFENVPADARVCYLRSLLLKRLDRLNTYVEIERTFPKDKQEDTEDEMDEWDDDPWAEKDGGSSSKPTPLITSGGTPTISLVEFLDNDLILSACELATSQALEPLRIVLQRHLQELWPFRFQILDLVPEYTHPSACRDLFPSIDPSTEAESVVRGERWRPEDDFTEMPDTVSAVNDSGVVDVLKSEESSISYSQTPNPLTAEELSQWYKARVIKSLNSTGMVDVALALVQHGASLGVPSLDELGEELSLLSKLIYDTHQAVESSDDWTLDRWYSMDPLTVVRAYLAHSTLESLPGDIIRLVKPYLFVLEARAERSGHPDYTLATRIFDEYILTSPLETVATIFEVSKPTLPVPQRIVKNDEDLARLALACLYGSSSLDEWSTMSRIFECLPVWEVPDSDESEETADTTIASLGAFVTPKTGEQPCTAMDLHVFFKPLPFASLSRALDILDVHLESGEILSRWSVPAPLRWLLQSAGDSNEQRAWATRMARRAGGQHDQLNSLEDWEWLLEDMLKLTGNGDPGARGAFSLLSTKEVSKIFLNGLLSNGKFSIAKSMLYSSKRLLDLSPSEIEVICLDASRELYDNASSANYKFGDMKQAYDCLDVPATSESIVKEREFIEATSRIASFNVVSAPGTPISPIEIRLTKDRLMLISRVLSSNNDAYKHSEVILELGYKLGYRGDVVAQIKILAMLADTALQAEDFLCSYANCQSMVKEVISLQKAAQSTPFNSKVDEAVEVCWIACFQLGRQTEFEDLNKKMTVLGQALQLCPQDKIHDVLAAWRKLQAEDIKDRQERLVRDKSNDNVASKHQRKLVPQDVASTLRAKLHDLHMPSPPLLSTPDAAALASRTFKSVAANFPFKVGHRPRSDMDERTSYRSDNSRRTDGEDVISNPASRVLSKGIGWLIGADED